MRRYLALLLPASILFAVFFYASFFWNFNSTLSLWSTGGFAWPHQMFHNFLHGRMLQSSLFADPFLAGGSVGFTHNPYAYINGSVIHINFTPYLFALIWSLFPTPAMIYGLIFAWNLLAGGLFSWLIIRKLADKDAKEKTAFVIAIMLASGFLAILVQMAQFLLFAGPFMMAGYYFFLIRKRAAFIAAIAALCLVSEDSAMVAACFALYFAIFETEGRWYGAASALISIPYVLFLLIIIQPAARMDLTITSSTTTSLVLGKIAILSPMLLISNIKSMMPLATLVPAFAAAVWIFGKPDRNRLISTAALAVLPSLPHWGECVVMGGAHHLLPPFVFSYIALLRIVGEGRQDTTEALKLRPGPIWTMTLLLFLISTRVLAGNLPNSIKPRLYRLAGKTEKARLLEQSLAGTAKSNRSAIAAAAEIPIERSLVYLVNKSVEGWITARSDIWRFPLLLDRADYALIQKDAVDPTFTFDADSGEEPWDAFRRGRVPEGHDAPLTSAMLKMIRDELIGRTHEVVLENSHVLLLKNLNPRPPLSAPSTTGFGFLRKRTAVADVDWDRYVERTR